MPTYVCARRLFLRTSRRSGSAPRFDSLVLSEVPGTILCTCAQGEGTSHHTARYKALLAPRVGAQPFLAHRSFTTWGSGHGHRQYKARCRLWFGNFLRSPVVAVSPERAKREFLSPWPCQRRRHRARHAISTSSWSSARSCSHGAIVMNSY